VTLGEPGPANFDDLLLELRDLVESARTMPMSASVLVNREEILGLVDEINAAMPEEVRHARWLLKERDEFLAQARREADDIIESARVQAERMVERTEIAREARRVSQKIVDDADAQARRLRLECEDYIDHKLAEFEVVLERTMQAVQNGRERLQVTIGPLEPEEPEDLEAGGFFDQDET
jgi:F0F1-type ATP synthase membrane subunit b/b'